MTLLVPSNMWEDNLITVQVGIYEEFNGKKTAYKWIILLSFWVLVLTGPISETTTVMSNLFEKCCQKFQKKSKEKTLTKTDLIFFTQNLERLVTVWAILHQDNRWNCLKNIRWGTKNDDITSHDNNIKLCGCSGSK